MIKVIVFDLGGTLMEYIGMPYSWEEYYNQGFEEINKFYKCGVSASCIGNLTEKGIQNCSTDRLTNSNAG